MSEIWSRFNSAVGEGASSSLPMGSKKAAAKAICLPQTTWSGGFFNNFNRDFLLAVWYGVAWYFDVAHALVLALVVTLVITLAVFFCAYAHACFVGGLKNSGAVLQATHIVFDDRVPQILFKERRKRR